MKATMETAGSPHQSGGHGHLGLVSERLASLLDRWRYGLIALVVLAQAGVLIHMVAGREWLLADGRQIDLKVVPVDPRDFFRGEYVRLSYDISRLPEQIVKAKGTVARGDRIYVHLHKSLDTWQAVATSTNPSQVSGTNDVVLIGRVTYARIGAADSSGTVHVTYGIEKFFLPEGTGREIEKQVRTSDVTAHVSVGGDGTAALKGLTVSGKRYDMPPLF